jgi:hypothetical protein
MGVGKVRERLSVSKQMAKSFDVAKYHLLGKLTVIPIAIYLVVRKVRNI